MREKIFSFGPNDGLVGILTEPDTQVAKRDAPIVLSSNVGLNHRVGPFRLYVDLARRLAARGYSMLRFDLSGLGDSAPRTDKVDELGRAVLDVKEAMSTLAARKGAQRFIQLGMCSGVDSAHTVTVEDPRVVGAIFVEGYAFRTPQFYLRRYLQRPLSPRFWEVYLNRKLRKYVAALRDKVRQPGDVEEIYTRAYPRPEQLTREYSALLARGVELLFVYAGGLGADQGYNYAAQFADVFPTIARDRHVEVEYYSRADHTYSVTTDRERLMERIEAWLEARFP
jgi:alpha-beta hydrolase superfamily lysophospholipase